MLKQFDRRLEWVTPAHIAPGNERAAVFKSQCNPTKGVRYGLA